MGLFSKKQTIEELEDERDRSRLKADIAGYQSQEAERQALVKQLKREYGGGWKKLLGVSGRADNSTLRSFLSGAKQGMEKQARPIRENPLRRM
jgi:hypothetical protein